MTYDRDNFLNYEYGLEIIQGLMGSGKSFIAIVRMIKAILLTRRPVYTNLPLKWKVVRKYLRLKGGEELANLIRPLDQEYWRRFLRRQEKVALFKDEHKNTPPQDLTEEQLQQLSEATGKTTDYLKAQPSLHNSQLHKWYDHIYGPGKEVGVDADHIPLGSIIIIDEVQHWHPMSKQGKDPDGEQLLAYLTMCRHHIHWIWVITQDRTRINIQFRVFFKTLWIVRNRGESKLAWGIRYKHLGMKGLGYEKFSRDQVEGTDPEDKKPLESFTIMSHLKKYQVYFRLYSSHIHAGSMRQIRRQVKEARIKSGLDEHGTTKQEKQMESKQMKKERSIVRRATRKLIKYAFIALFVFITYQAGRFSNNINAVKQETVTNETTTQQQITWPSYNGFASGMPMLNGKTTQVGAEIMPGATLRHSNAQNRALVIQYDGGLWLWAYGQQTPQPVGEIATVQRAYEQWKLHGERSPQEAFGDGS